MNDEILLNLKLLKLKDDVTGQEMPKSVIRDRGNVYESVEDLIGYGVRYKKIGFINFKVYLLSVYIPRKKLFDDI